MNVTLLSICLKNFNYSPHFSIVRLTKHTSLSISKAFISKSFSGFIHRNTQLSSLSIDNSFFSNTIDSIIKDNLQNMTFIDQIMNMSESTDNVIVKRCSFINCTADSGILIIGDFSQSASKCSVLNCEFHHCFSVKFGCIRVYVKETIIKGSCFHDLCSNSLATAIYAASADQKINEIIDNTFLFCRSDAVAFDPIIMVQKGFFKISKQNMSHCSAQSPTFIMIMKARCNIEICSFLHSEAATCIQINYVGRDIKMIDGMIHNISLAYEVIDVLSFSNSNPKISIEHYSFEVKPGMNRILPSSVDEVIITLVDCYSEYKISDYFPKNVTLITYGVHENTVFDLYTWHFPAANGCNIFTETEKIHQSQKFQNAYVYVTVFVCVTVLLIMFLVTCYMLLLKKPLEPRSERLTTVDDF